MKNDAAKMNRIIPFEYRDGRNIRVVIRDGEPWFVARDVCDVLGISQYRRACRDDGRRAASFDGLRLKDAQNL